MTMSWREKYWCDILYDKCMTYQMQSRDSMMLSSCHMPLCVQRATGYSFIYTHKMETEMSRSEICSSSAKDLFDIGKMLTVGGGGVVRNDSGCTWRYDDIGGEGLKLLRFPHVCPWKNCEVLLRCCTQSGHSSLKLMSKLGQHHGTSIALILTSCCQIANIWRSTHGVNMMPRMFIENYYWQNNLEKKNVGWEKMLVEKKSWLRKISLMPMCGINLMTTVDVNLMLTLMLQKLSFLTYGW